MVEAIRLHVTMSEKRQRLEQINIGFLTVQGSVSEAENQALVQWLVVSRIAILTGFFGDNKGLVETLAIKAAAIGYTPFYQDLWCQNNRSRGWECLTHPSYFLLFGLYRAMRWPASTPTLPDDFELGEDIRNDMILIRHSPEWPRNDQGSTSVPKLGNIKMKEVDWNKWCPQTFQTCLWLGTATPSKKSQEKSKLRSRGKGSKHNSTGKARGSGK